MEVINALMRNTIDPKRATLILRALHIAVKNAHRVRYNTTSNMVKEVPEYAAPAPAEAPAPESEFDLPYEAAIAVPSERESAMDQKRIANALAEQDRESRHPSHSAPRRPGNRQLAAPSPKHPAAPRTRQAE